MKPFFVASLALCLLCLSCAPRTAKPIATIDRNIDWPVLAIAPDLPAQVGMHYVTLRKGQKTFRFEATIEMEPNHQAMVGMTPVGTIGFTMKSDTNTIEFERIPFYKMPIRPEQILTAYHWTFLDEAILEPHLRKLGLTIKHPDPKTRIIQSAGESIATISYEDNNKQRGLAEFRLPDRKIHISFLTRSMMPL